MFSGIIEAAMPIIRAQKTEHLIRIGVRRPVDFDDLKIGDSISVDGVCLTVEEFNENEIQFAIGFETLKILQATEVAYWVNKQVNLERSLRFGDRIHGHLVSGHVTAVGRVLELKNVGECLIVRFSLPSQLVPYCTQKGSITFNGVSLTINDIQKNKESMNDVSRVDSFTDDNSIEVAEVCLIPETLKKTNLGSLKIGDSINLEPDFYVKVLVQYFEQNKILNTTQFQGVFKNV